MNFTNGTQAQGIREKWEERKMRTARDQPLLPTHRAFVVQLYAASRIEKGQFKGRVEHIVSGRSTHFSTMKALKAFMHRVLTEEQPDEPED